MCIRISASGRSRAIPRAFVAKAPGPFASAKSRTRFGPPRQLPPCRLLRPACKVRAGNQFQCPSPTRAAAAASSRPWRPLGTARRAAGRRPQPTAPSCMSRSQNVFALSRFPQRTWVVISASSRPSSMPQMKAATRLANSVSCRCFHTLGPRHLGHEPTHLHDVEDRRADNPLLRIRVPARNCLEPLISAPPCEASSRWRMKRMIVAAVTSPEPRRPLQDERQFADPIIQIGADGHPIVKLGQPRWIASCSSLTRWCAVRKEMRSPHLLNERSSRLTA